jgi:hypothetical protein
MEHWKHDIETDAGDRRGASRIRPRVRTSLDGKHGVFTGMRHKMGFASGADGTGSFEPRLLDDVRGGNRRRCFVSERPPAVLFNADGNGLAMAAVRCDDQAAEATETSCSPERPP